MDRFQNDEWSEPVHLGPEVNSSSRELRPSISPDELSLYFNSDRLGGFGDLDLWISRRDCKDCPWQPAVNAGPTINGPGSDGGAAFSNDGHLLFFVATKPSGGFGGEDIYVSYREDPHDDFGWGPPVNLGPDVNTAGSDNSPAFVQNAQGAYAELYFNRSSTANETEIYRVQLRRNGDVVETLGPAVPVEELNFAGAFNNSPTIRGDGKELIFWSNRPGGLGQSDLWVSTRQTPHDSWSPPVNLGAPVNSVFGELDASLSLDGRTLYFSATMNRGSLGRQDIWMSTRTPSTP
jgi:Tol biopolymer transport system component